MKKTKQDTMPVHYVEGWGKTQVQCRGSGKTGYRDQDVRTCSRPRSTKCVNCGRRVTLNRNGTYPVHNDTYGKRCKYGEANRR